MMYIQNEFKENLKLKKMGSNNLISKDRVHSESSKQGVNFKQIPDLDNYFITDRQLMVDGNSIDVIQDKGDKFRIVSIRSTRRGKKYLTFDVYESGNSSKKQLLLHRARLQVFKGDSPNDKRIVRHLNGDASDNNIDNLAWGSHQENMTDLKAHGSQKGSKNPSSKIIEHEAVAIYVIAELGLLNRSTRLRFCSLSQTQIYKIKKMKAWEHAINQNIQDWVQIAKNLLIEKNFELVNKHVKQKNLLEQDM